MVLKMYWVVRLRHSPDLLACQLSLLLFAQVMVQMMVEAAFSSNAPNLKVKVAQVLVG